MDKKKLRTTILTMLKSQDREWKSHYDKRLAERLFCLPIYQTATTIAVYLSFDFEYDTTLVIERALADGKRIVIPKTYPKGKMIFVDYDPKTLVTSSFGVPEPESSQEVAKEMIDLVVVPGVVFNDQGYRIGYGAGYYDRYLKDYQGETVSLIYPSQLSYFIPQKYDIPVKGLLYEKSATHF
ncbi:5-formyltetrahydrofolate cyclo-ligase [Streptococcus sp. S784/96/1]|uniref:5-formyltetrahydrofolate cyclo-ligase n=1 Tax=Streptococcus sp. S784/96/1 TaxID=2653499 RepID=UPI0013869883|nr:5-formyltetrahydrofolate cyclo-ligase [Streptococcus sp. S784/96/1]